MSRRSGLGRGLAALIPPNPHAQEQAETEARPTAEVGPRDDAPARPAAEVAGPTPDEPEAGQPSSEGVGLDAAANPEASREPGVTPVQGPMSYAEVPPTAIRPNPRQPREVFDPDELEGLAVSLQDVGVLQPLVVRAMGADGYELIAGERRLRAALLAGLDTVPVLIRHTDDADLLKEALVENIHRVQLNPLEEAAAYQQLLEEFGVTQEELAAKLGRSRPAISNTIRLLQLPPAVQRRVAAGVLSAGHARAILAVEDADGQTLLADRVVAEGLSVRATEELVRVRLMDEESQPRRARRRPPTAPGLLELQDDLSDALQARVRITMGARKGKLAVEFTSVDELERIVAVIADGLGAGGPSQDRPVTPSSPTPATDLSWDE